MIGLLGGVLEQNEPTLAILVHMGPLEELYCTQSPFCFKSCMIGLLGAVLEQNEPTLAILVLLGAVGGCLLALLEVLIGTLHTF